MSELNIPSTGITFVKFGAEWCGPCKLLDKTLSQFEKTAAINVIKYDIDEETELATKFNIMSVPTVRVYKDGEYTGAFVGAMPVQYIQNIINGTNILDK